MNKYRLVFKQAINEILEYRVDFMLSLFKYTAMVLMMIFVWTAVQQAAHSSILSLNDTVVYFFLAATLYSLSNFHPYYIEDDIRLGGLNKYLTKPISPMNYYFTYEAAKVFIETAIKMGFLLPIIYLLGFQLKFNPSQLVYFILYMPLIYTFSFNFLSIISITAFWITEASALRWAVLIIVRFLSGMLVPISFFAPPLQQLSNYLPFQYLGYVPIHLMLYPSSNNQMFEGLLVLAVWTTITICFRHWYWKKGVELYEGVGI